MGCLNFSFDEGAEAEGLVVNSNAYSSEDVPLCHGVLGSGILGSTPEPISDFEFGTVYLV